MGMVRVGLGWGLARGKDFGQGWFDDKRPGQFTVLCQTKLDKTTGNVFVVKWVFSKTTNSEASLNSSERNSFWYNICLAMKPYFSQYFLVEYYDVVLPVWKEKSNFLITCIKQETADFFYIFFIILFSNHALPVFFIIVTSNSGNFLFH